uniref:Nonstructural protein 5 n=1 Tax=Maize stripe virus TaxID=3052767 RepID=J7FI09_MSTV|nr:nonstructural protein 5 [Tenuivirus zeae]
MAWTGPIKGTFSGMVPRHLRRTPEQTRDVIDSERLLYHRFRALFREGASQSPLETCCRNHKRSSARADQTNVRVKKTMVAKTRTPRAIHPLSEKVYSVRKIFKQLPSNKPSRIVPVRENGCRWRKVVYHRAHFEELPMSFKLSPRAYPRFNCLVRKHGYGKTIRMVSCYASGISEAKNSLARTIREKFARSAYLSGVRQVPPPLKREDFGTWNDYREELKKNQTKWYLCRVHYRQAYDRLYDQEFRYWKGHCSFETTRPRVKCGDWQSPLDSLVALQAPPMDLVCNAPTQLPTAIPVPDHPSYKKYKLSDLSWTKQHERAVREGQKRLQKAVGEKDKIKDKYGVQHERLYRQNFMKNFRRIAEMGRSSAPRGPFL